MRFSRISSHKNTTRYLATICGLRKWLFLGAKKWDYGRPNPKTENTNSIAYNPQKYWFRHLFHVNITFRRVLNKILKIAYFRLIFGQFPLIKPKTYDALAQIRSLEMGVLDFSYIEAVVVKWPGLKKVFLIFSVTLQAMYKLTKLKFGWIS